jgi:hypothetical protein
VHDLPRHNVENPIFLEFFKQQGHLIETMHKSNNLQAAALLQATQAQTAAMLQAGAAQAAASAAQAATLARSIEALTAIHSTAQGAELAQVTALTQSAKAVATATTALAAAAAAQPQRDKDRSVGADIKVAHAAAQTDIATTLAAAWERAVRSWSSTHPIEADKLTPIIADLRAAMHAQAFTSVAQKARFVVLVLSRADVPEAIRERIATLNDAKKAADFYDAGQDESVHKAARFAVFLRDLVGAQISLDDLVPVSLSGDISKWMAGASLRVMLEELYVGQSAASEAATAEMLALVPEAARAAASAAMRRMNEATIVGSFVARLKRHIPLNKMGAAQLCADLAAASTAQTPFISLLAVLNTLTYAALTLIKATSSTAYIGILTDESLQALAPVPIHVALGVAGATMVVAVADTGAPHGVVDAAYLHALDPALWRDVPVTRRFEMADGSKPRCVRAVQLLVRPFFAGDDAPARWLTFHVLDFGSALFPTTLILGVAQLAECGGAAIHISDAATTSVGPAIEPAARAAAARAPQLVPLGAAAKAKAFDSILVLTGTAAQQVHVGDGCWSLEVAVPSGTAELIGDDERVMSLLLDSDRVASLMSELDAAMAAEAPASALLS